MSDADHSTVDADISARLLSVTAEAWVRLFRCHTLLRESGEYGGWTPAKEISPGHYAMGYSTISNDAEAVVEAIYGLDVMSGFDWPEWAEGFALLEDRRRIAEVPVVTAVKLVTLCIRGQRFSEGSLLAEFQNGNMATLTAKILTASPAR